MAKLGILAGLGVGYVLGTRAGRERYDQMKQMAQQVMRDPRVKKQAAHAQAVVSEKASQAQEAVSEKATQAAGYVQDAVKEQVHGMTGKGATGPTSGNGSSAGTGTSTGTGSTSGQ